MAFVRGLCTFLVFLYANIAWAQSDTTVSGTVQASPGQTLEGVRVYACIVPKDECYSGPAAEVKGAPTTASFSLPGLDRNQDYLIVAHQDKNGDNTPSDGDAFAAVRSVTPPAQGIVLSFQPPSHLSISGIVKAPPGQSVKGTVIIVCPADKLCRTPAVKDPIEGDGPEAPFRVTNVNRYDRLLAWKDTNNNNELDGNDATSGEQQILGPLQGLVLTMK